MHNSQEHVFTNEFDEVCIVISLDTGSASTSLKVTISEPNGLWDECMPISMDNLHQKDTR